MGIIRSEENECEWRTSSRSRETSRDSDEDIAMWWRGCGQTKQCIWGGVGCWVGRVGALGEANRGREMDFECTAEGSSDVNCFSDPAQGI